MATSLRPSPCAGRVRRSTRARAGALAPAAAAALPRRAADASGVLSRLGGGAAALALSLSLLCASPSASLAGELDVLKSAPPAQGAVLDDAALLSRSSASTLSAASKAIEDETGVRVTVVTLRKLQLQPDAFAFADKLIETWYPTREEGDKKVVLLLVKASKEGALVAGPSAGAALKPLIESVATDTVPFYAEQEKYGEALTKALGRVGEALAGRVDPGPPERARAAAGSNFRSKQETADNKGKYVAVVGGLLVIAFIVPMVQYFGYVRKD